MSLWKGLSTLLAASLVTAACAVTPSPSSSAGESVAPFVSTAYPQDAPADCAYGGEMAQIRAVDRLTVEFSLCYPDPAFLSKVALANNAIQDSDWLTRYGADRSLLSTANGTGPYMVTNGAPLVGDQITLGRYDGYWGAKATAAQVLVQWNADAASRVLALSSGRVDGIDNPDPAALDTIQGNAALQLQPREALSTLYIGMSNTYAPFDNLRIRQALAMGIDRQRIVDNLLPPGSTLAQYFTPCSIEFGCTGTRWYPHDRAAARAVLANPGISGPLTTHVYYRDQADCGMPDPSLVAQELETQLDDLGFKADLRPEGSEAFLHDLSAGLVDGLFVLESCPASPDISSFLDELFNNAANPQFGTVDRSITNALTAGDGTADPAARRLAYEQANNAIRDQVPMIPIAHGGSATVWKGDVTAAVSSPLDAEQFAVMDPGGRPQLVWMQTASPSSFDCADETDGDSVRICQNVFEELYGFKPGTADVTPSLAESCAANQDLTVWTCHLRSGVTFHDGSQLDANDVVLSFARQWDDKGSQHIGRTGAFARWAAEFGAFLNAPPALP
jgi:ABC-type transport system substrate-binding protein